MTRRYLGLTGREWLYATAGAVLAGPVLYALVLITLLAGEP